MNKSVLKIFLTEEVNDQELDEALPKDLAQAYNNSNLGLENRRNGYRANQIDWQNTDYTAITPEEGKEVWKNNPRGLVLIIKDRYGNPRAVKFREDGKVDIDARYGNYRFDLPQDKAYIKRDGTKVRDVFKVKINHLLSIADKIYKTNEGSVQKDTNLQAARRLNPESPYSNVEGRSDVINKYRGANQKSSRLLQKVKWWNENRNYDQATAERGLRDYRITYDPATNQVTGGWSYSYGGTGDVNFWFEKVKKYWDSFLASDGDTYGAWLAYLLADGKGTLNYRIPTEKEISKWFGLSDIWKQDMNAELRYLDVANILKEPKKKIEQSIQDAKDLEYQLERQQSRKTDFTSPEQRASRESDINYYITRYKSQLNNILQELEKYEGRLDDLDASDAKKIQEMDNEISRITKELADAKNATANIMSQGAYTNSAFGKKFPESLEEEKSLDELVDILQGRKTENLDEDFDGDEDRIMALAEFLDIDPNEIEVSGDEYVTPEGDYLVLTEEEAHDRAVDEIRMTFDDMGLEAFTPQFQKQIVNDFMSDKVIDDFIDQEIEYFQNEEDDADMLYYLQGLETKEEKLNYIKEAFGDLEDFVKPEDIDIEAVAEEAINQDGIAHFIAYYDGEEEELGNGFLAYRIN